MGLMRQNDFSRESRLKQGQAASSIDWAEKKHKYPPDPVYLGLNSPKKRPQVKKHQDTNLQTMFRNCYLDDLALNWVYSIEEN